MDKPLKDFKVEKDFKDQIDKILNLHFFRKLSSKTQVILSLAGPTVRTRLTHTVEVARIARKLCEILGLNSDLAEAIALAHDLGHTPFGHVGERALKEIMCGCDTLKNKINDIDFMNSGFKHNLQSFRVLRTLEAVSDSDDKWPYVLWGVPAHSNMTWSKPYSGMENEILISCKHCDLVYSCFYHERKECKRNIQKKRKVKVDGDKDNLCRPSFCAKLAVYESRDKVPGDLPKPGETKEEYLGFFENPSQIFCTKPCYLAELAKHKIEKKEIVNMFHFFYDHPFPNSFYGPHFYDYFSKKDKDFISVEALIVSQADEIAQRQQDLEDAVSTELISFEVAKKDVETLVGKKSSAKNQKELGEAVVHYYSNNLKDATIVNFAEFSKERNQQINIFCLMNILYSLDDNGKKRRITWIMEQIQELIGTKDIAPIANLETVFQLNYTESYFYFIVYDLLEIDLRFGEYDNCRKILPALSNLFENRGMPIIEMKDDTDFSLIKALDRLRKILETNCNNEYRFFFKPARNDDDNYCKKVTQLNLYTFHIVHKIYQHFNSSKPDTIFRIYDLRNIAVDPIKEAYYVKVAFDNWTRIMRSDANRVLANLVKFTNDNGIETRFKEFADKQKDYILKSELVEKNDGKANYILKKLFSAFITNSHQLPDNGLDYILLSLTTESTMQLFLIDERETFLRILSKLKKTTISGYGEIERQMDSDLLTLNIDDFDNIISSNEIKALLEKRKRLCVFCQCFMNETRINLDLWIRSEARDPRRQLEISRLRFRGILDNPILNAMPYWKSLLTRGICDYIASLTDQEAIDQYEKLYASVMELI